jgi:hypothetical protein
MRLRVACKVFARGMLCTAEELPYRDRTLQAAVDKFYARIQARWHSAGRRRQSRTGGIRPTTGS